MLASSGAVDIEQNYRVKKVIETRHWPDLDEAVVNLSLDSCQRLVWYRWAEHTLFETLWAEYPR